MTAQIEFQSSAKPPMSLLYKHPGAPNGETFQIPAIIPSELLDIQAEAARSKPQDGRSKKQQDEHKQRIGMKMIDLFRERVLPPEMRTVLHLPDVGGIFELWGEYVELGEGRSSDD